MDWKQRLQSARESGQRGLEEKSEATIKQYWPQIQELFKEKVGPAALAAAHNDQTMESAFKLVYAALPFPIHLAVKEEVFVKFCFSHRDKLLLSGDAAAGSS
jgi:hypothetical protein